MKIVILGYIVKGPLGGLAWHHLQYVLGLKQMGHKVLFIEDSDDYPACYNPESFETSKNPDYGLRFINELFTACDLKEQWAYFDAHTNCWFGLNMERVLKFCESADAVLNISGVNPLRSWWANISLRVFIDTDPGFTQIKNLTESTSKNLADAHTSFFSFAENIGKSHCLIPNDGFNWIATRQPVYLPVWKTAPPNPLLKWTTVMQWDSYKVREYMGQPFGMKSLSFNDFINVPKRIPDESFELALGSTTAPVEQLKSKGWHIVSSLIPTKTPGTYQQYIQSSKGEWSIAKHGYVASNSGWFSERSLCYLASGKPVLIQDTGFSAVIETGQGILTFNTIEEVQEEMKKINSDYNFHCTQARKSVEEFFESSQVLKRLLNEAG